ncbi:hypothetical protein V6N11_032408 [Hibiscus sabdariffa]|uniref:Uncharacterized protein n=1 Tax=Hibiscus sabdariffa TaxID=183260 RepID=A0ABR2T138_9ROSI
MGHKFLWELLEDCVNCCVTFIVAQLIFTMGEALFINTMLSICIKLHVHELHTRNVAMDVGEEEKAILTDWACNCFSEGTVDALVENDAEALSDRMKLERFVMVALWCIQAHHEESSADA